MYNGAATVENSLVLPQQVKHKTTIKPSISAPWYIPKKTENSFSNECMYAYVQSSIFHTNQKVKTTQKNGLMAKQIMIYTYNTIAFSNRRLKYYTCYNRHEPSKLYLT